MYQLIRTIGDIIFPPREEALIVRNITQGDLRALYSPQYVDGIWSCASFQDTTVRALIHETKFHRSAEAWKKLGILLGWFLSEHRIPHPALILPIPLSSERRRSRGYNQVEKTILTVPDLPTYGTLSTSILYRVRDTTPQTTHSRAERLTNIVNAFDIRHADTLQGKHIIVIDDVATTGATLEEAKRVLSSANPASCRLISLAH